MALPLVYNVESVRSRWRSAVVAVLGVAGSVGVFVAMLALASGFRVAVVTSGSPDNLMVRRAGATSEIDSAVTLEQLRVIEDSPEVRRSETGPLVSPEVVVIAALPLKTTGTDANVQVRGLYARALEVHDQVRITEGRLFGPGLYELVVGRNATTAYRGLALGDTVRLGGSAFTVVGIFDAGGSSFDSEVWADADVLIPTYQRPRGVYQSVAARLTSRDALEGMKTRLVADPRFTVQIERETDYYARASRMMTGMILGLGSLVAVVMGVGAVFGALNTMYSAVSERSREIATIRARGDVVRRGGPHDLLGRGPARLCCGPARQWPDHLHAELPDVLPPLLRVSHHARAPGLWLAVRGGDGARRRCASRGASGASAGYRRAQGSVGVILSPLRRAVRAKNLVTGHNVYARWFNHSS